MFAEAVIYGEADRAVEWGNRADTAALADNVSNCVVEAEFDLAGYDLQPFFEEQDLEYDDHCTVRRVITPAGKSRAYVNDLPVQLATLKELGLRLVDIHSQHRSLLVVLKKLFIILILAKFRIKLFWIRR